jgi:hypothetical protein
MAPAPRPPARDNSDGSQQAQPPSNPSLYLSLPSRHKPVSLLPSSQLLLIIPWQPRVELNKHMAICRCRLDRFDHYSRAQAK